MPLFDVLVAGEINPDLILTGDVTPQFGQAEKLIDGAALSIGSSSVIFACGAARLGLKVAFIGVCGEDVFGQFMLAEMAKRNIDTTNVVTQPNGHTGLSVILNSGADRAILTYPGLIPALRADDITDTLLQQARHLHSASYFLQTNLQPDLPKLFQRARSFGLTTSLDTNYDPTERWSGLDELLPVTNVFLPNRAEALSLTATNSIDTAIERLKNKVETLAIKLGAEGASACRGTVTASAQSLSVEVVDTVGAGDSFDAGFIYGYLNNWELEKSLRLACVCGSLSTRAAGGTAAQATIEEAISFVGAR